MQGRCVLSVEDIGNIASYLTNQSDIAPQEIRYSLTSLHTLHFSTNSDYP